MPYSPHFTLDDKQPHRSRAERGNKQATQSRGRHGSVHFISRAIRRANAFSKINFIELLLGEETESFEVRSQQN